MKVIKFGGSSLANGSQLKKVIDIIISDPTRTTVVVSAPGKRFKGDIKVTDLLVKLASTAIHSAPTESLITEIMSRYAEIAGSFSGQYDAILAQLESQLRHIVAQHYPSYDHLIAAFTAQGENLNAQLVANILTQNNHPADYVSPIDLGLRLKGNPRSAHLIESSYTTLNKYQHPADSIIIIPGFFGITEDNQLATFSRGGSDITGAIIARGLHADLYENFTDVSAIYAVDPHIIDHPAAITKMSYREMRELAYAGFAVFHEEAIVPVIEANIQINVKNTNNPDAPGTLIVPVHDTKPTGPITGIASDSRFVALYLHRYLLNSEVGFTLKILEILAEYNISYEHMPSGIDDLTIILDGSQLTPQIIKHVEADIVAAVHPDIIDWIHDYAIIMVVGEGLKDKSSTLETITHALAENNINLPMINQGASQISLMLGVREGQVNAAVKAIYNATFIH